MALIAKISDGLGGTKTLLKVTTRGQAVVGPIAFSEASSAALTVDDVPVNLFTPRSGKNFIITDIIIKGDKSIDNNVDATVTIYETSVGPTSTTQTKVILPTKIARSGGLTLVGLNLEVSTGVWINAVTDDNNVFVTVMGYYVDVE